MTLLILCPRACCSFFRYYDVVGERRCAVVDTYWQVGVCQCWWMFMYVCGCDEILCCVVVVAGVVVVPVELLLLLFMARFTLTLRSLILCVRWCVCVCTPTTDGNRRDHLFCTSRCNGHEARFCRTAVLWHRYRHYRSTHWRAFGSRSARW
jgi:hypothetical protein